MHVKLSPVLHIVRAIIKTSRNFVHTQAQSQCWTCKNLSVPVLLERLVQLAELQAQYRFTNYESFGVCVWWALPFGLYSSRHPHIYAPKQGASATYMAWSEP